MEKTIRINNHGAGFEEAVEETVRLAQEHDLSQKQQSQIRLLTEEIIEMIKHFHVDFEGDLTETIDKGVFELRIVSKADMDSSKREGLQKLVSKSDSSSELSGKIRAILESRFYDDKEEDPELLEQMGIKRVKAENGENNENSEEDPAGDEYVWSLQNYGFKTFDRQKLMEEIKPDWAEISRSIIGNLSDDVRIYIFRNHIDFIITKQLEEMAGVAMSRKSDINGDKTPLMVETHGEWKLDPELEILKKVPIPTTKVQVKMLQLLYGGLMKREKGDADVSVKVIKIPCERSPKKSLRCAVYTPKGCEDKVLPTVLLLHGGAFVLPALPYHYRLARYTAKHTGCRVYMPDYDLAPTHKSPTQHEEAYEIYGRLTDNASEYLINTDKLVIMGDSAGGTLCAALCLRLIGEGRPVPTGQLLLYPSLDTRLQSKSIRTYLDTPVCNTRAVIEYYKLCVSKDDHAPRVYSSPVEAESLKGMPPTYVETAEFDCLHDDGVLFADRLSKEDCDVVLNETKGTVHSYDMAVNSRILKDSLEKRARFIKTLIEE